MEVLSIKTYSGPNLWSYKPLVHMVVDIGEFEHKPSDAIEGFTDRLLELIPSLQQHKCSVGVPGGFIQRLRTGTWMGHIVEHVAIELQVLAGNEVAFGKCRSTDTPGVYNVVFEFLEEKVGLEAAQIAMALVEAVARNTPFELKPKLDNLAQMVADLAFGPSTLSIIQEARSRGIPIIRLNDANLVQLGYGRFQERIQATTTSMTKMIAVDIACDKDLTKKLLADVGIPVPQGVVVDNQEDAVREGEYIGYPLVCKPMDLSQGRGISLNIVNRESLIEAFKLAAEYTSRVVVEKFLFGKDYRILVVNGKVIAVSERLPAQVVGDGKSTLQQLIDTLNEDPRRGVGHEKVLTKVRIDVPTRQLMKSQGVTLESVIAAGQTILLKATANLSTGGTAVDRTDDIHVDNIEMAIRASKVVGLDIAGIDVITPDLSEPIYVVGGGIVEVNAAPGFRMHVAPSEGKPRPVARAVVDMLFPPGKSSRVPIIAITGTNGKTTTARMCAHVMKMAGKKVGLTTTDAIYIDGHVLRRGDMTGPWSARMVLKDPTIDFAVLETARGGMLRSGLGFERCDVGAVLNISDDHLGQGGINTLEDLAYVKQMIIDVVRKDGFGVFNAEDPLSYGMVDRCDGQRTFFSLNPKAPRFLQALEDGCLGATLQNDRLVLREGTRRHLDIVSAAEVPATYGGFSDANIKNALAACLMVYCLGASIDDIRQGLQTFDASYHLTPGRLNMIPVRDYRVLIDYAHNIAAYETMASFVQKLYKARTIGVIACPGDRLDVNLIRMGEIAGPVFDHIIIREDDNRRGREVGETARLIQEGVNKTARASTQVDVVLEESAAVEFGLKQCKADDLLVLLADDIDRTWAQVNKHRREHLADQFLDLGLGALTGLRRLQKTIAGYHAHVYFDTGSLDSIASMRDRMQAELGDKVRVSTLRDGPVGPHPLPMFEVQIPVGQFEAAVGWLMVHHGSHSVLLHPVTGNDLEDHRDHPAWLGTPLPLKLETLS